MNETATFSSLMLPEPTARQPWTMSKYAVKNNFQPLTKLIHKFSEQHSSSRVGLILEKLKNIKFHQYIMGNAIVLARLDEMSSGNAIVLARLDEMSSKLDSIDNSLRGKRGIDAARKYTVEIFLNDSSLGTGLVLREESDVGTHRFFVMTAAHVAIQALSKCSIHIKPICTGGQRILVMESKDEPEVFLPKSYVLDGFHDIGLFRVKDPCADNNTQRYSVEELNIENSHPFDVRYFGQTADVRMKGESISYENGRVRTTCHSKPGCSGTPIFSEDGKLNSLLHGDSKHRGKKMHSNSSDDEFSTFVHLDTVTGINGFHKANNVYSSIFKSMEEIHADEWVHKGEALSDEAAKFCTQIFTQAKEHEPAESEGKLQLAALLLIKLAFDDGEVLNRRDDGVLDAVAWHPPRSASS